MKSRVFTVDGTPVEIVAAEPTNRTALIHVAGNNIVYLGGSDVTTANGLTTEKNAVPLTVEIPAGQSLYALAANGFTETLRVLVQGD